MVKRKREPSPAAAPDAAGSGKVRTTYQQHKAEHQLVHGKEALTKAFKLAKGFERQKFSRRQKTAKSRGDDKDVARIAAEIEALRTLDLFTVASNYLTKSLLKIKAVATSPHLPGSLAKPPAQTLDAPSLNVVARLCKSNPVRDALPAIIKGVQNALELESVDAPTRSTKPKSSDPTSDRPGHPGVSNDADDAAISQQNAPSNLNIESGASDEDEFVGFSTEQDDTNAVSDIDDAALDALDARLASSDDESDTPRPKAAIRALLDSHGPPSDSEDSLSDSDSPPERAKGLARRMERSSTPTPSDPPSPPPPAKRPATAAFLPSLTSGYISGGSDSDPEAEFDELLGTGGGAASAEKKNRRGQRARRQIWEKKYGKEAKHVREDQATGKKGRDEGWDAKRGATDGRGGWRGRGRGGRGGGGGRGGAFAAPAAAAKARTEAVPVKHRDDGGKLHPSWEAAKRRKEAGPAQVKFAGKKISFD